MAEIRTRENTFKVILSNFPKRPTFEEIHKFVRVNLGLGPEQVVRLQISHAQNCAYVKCSELKIAQETVANHNGKHVIEVDSIKIKIRLVMEDGGVEVKIHDLSENITNEEIMAFLQHYGDVLSIKETHWGSKYTFQGVSSGIRVAKMILRRHIKSFVTIQGEQTLISYTNQPETCRHCTLTQHIGMSCVENKKLLGQKATLTAKLTSTQSTSPTSYAGMVSSGLTTNTLQLKVVPDNSSTAHLSNSGSVTMVVADGNSAQNMVAPKDPGASLVVADLKTQQKNPTNEDEEMPIFSSSPVSTLESTFKVPAPIPDPTKDRKGDAGSDTDHSISSDSNPGRRKSGRPKKPKLDQ